MICAGRSRAGRCVHVHLPHGVAWRLPAGGPHPAHLEHLGPHAALLPRNALAAAHFRPGATHIQFMSCQTAVYTTVLNSQMRCPSGTARPPCPLPRPGCCAGKCLRPMHPGFCCKVERRGCANSWICKRNPSRSWEGAAQRRLWPNRCTWFSDAQLPQKKVVLL